MNFDFTEEQKLFADSVRRFADANLAKDALTRAHDPRFPCDVAKLMSAQGLMGITIPEADGGQGGTLMDAVIAIQEVALACPKSADIVQAGNFTQGGVRQGQAVLAAGLRGSDGARIGQVFQVLLFASVKPSHSCLD